jgi:hypothetical protein
MDVSAKVVRRHVFCPPGLPLLALPNTLERLLIRNLLWFCPLIIANEVAIVCNLVNDVSSVQTSG